MTDNELPADGAMNENPGEASSPSMDVNVVDADDGSTSNQTTDVDESSLAKAASSTSTENAEESNDVQAVEESVNKLESVELNVEDLESIGMEVEDLESGEISPTNEDVSIAEMVMDSIATFGNAADSDSDTNFVTADNAGHEPLNYSEITGNDLALSNVDVSLVEGNAEQISLDAISTADQELDFFKPNKSEDLPALDLALPLKRETTEGSPELGGDEAMDMDPDLDKHKSLNMEIEKVSALLVMILFSIIF